MSFKCDLCSEYKLWFDRDYPPDEYFEGDSNSDVWIVGLNPAGKVGTQDKRKRTALGRYFDKPDKIHPYFRAFKRVSPDLYEGLGRLGGVAHTDIVKCYSKTFPPDGKSRTGEAIVENCKRHFESQLKHHSPKMIICNGAAACREIERLVPKIDGRDFETHYFGSFDGCIIAVVLSGFIGRIDNYARRRLGKEIEQLLLEMRGADYHS